jgi:hypothetical protein
MSIVPSQNLVKNIGFSSNATHTKDEKNPLSKMESKQLDFPLIHPKEIIVSEESMNYSRKTFLPSNNKSILNKSISLSMRMFKRI